jgi:hypothetical protein
MRKYWIHIKLAANNYKMKTIILTKLILLFFITLISLDKLYAFQSDVNIPDVTIVSSSGSYKPFFPSITKLPNGKLIMVYYWNTSHVTTTGGKIFSKISTDNGETWSTSSLLVDYTGTHPGLDARDPHINVLSNGDLILNFFTGKWNNGYVQSPYQDHLIETRVAKCTDGTGTNWSDPVIVSTNRNSNATSGAIIELSNGNLLLPTYGSDNNGDSKAYVHISSDEGINWTEGIEVTNEYNAEGHNEMTLESINNVVYAITRPSGKIFKSIDNGLSWEIHSSEEHKMHAPDFLPLNNHSLFLTYCKADNEPLYKDRTVYGKIFNPSLNWDENPEKIIYESVCTNQDMGYPTSVITNDNRILTIYYHSGCRNIIGGTFSEFNEWGIEPGTLSVFESDPPDFNVIVYPVPTIDFINVLNPDGKTLTIELYHLNGAVISEYHTNIINIKIDLNNQTNGIYVLKVSNNKQKKVFKVIKK